MRDLVRPWSPGPQLPAHFLWEKLWYTFNMEFLTLHELSVQLDVSVRVLRHRLRQLLLAGKLVENLHCRRDDFVDDTHFVWRVDPVVFVRATGFRLATKPDNHESTTANHPGNQPRVTDNQTSNTGEPTLSKVDSRQSPMEREMIDMLKNQMLVKDGQIADLSEQNKALSSLNQKLNGAVLRQSDQIQSLLRLTGGKIDVVAFASDTDHPEGATANEPVTHGGRPVSKSATLGNHSGNSADEFSGGQGSSRAA